MRGYVLCGIESSFGSGSTSPTSILVTTFEDNVDRSLETLSYVDKDYPGFTVPVMLMVNGTIKTSLRPKMLVNLFHMAFGSKTDKSTYWLMEVDKPVSGELRAKSYDEVKKYVGVGVNQLTIVMEPNQIVETNWQWIAREVELIGEQADVYVSEEPLVTYKCQVSLNRGSVTHNKYNVQSCEIMFNFGLEGDYCTVDDFRLGHLFRSELVIVEGSIELMGADNYEVKSALFGHNTRVDYSDGNELDDVTMALTFSDLAGTPKCVFEIPIRYGTLSSSNVRGTIKRTFKFTGIGNNASVVLYK